MMTPKDRVKLNIYKQLLEEEKKKNKRISTVSISLFVFGIFASSTYHLVIQKTAPGGTPYIKSFVNAEKDKDMMMIEHIFEKKLVDDKKRDINADEFFALDIQI